jgi:copper resistance protein C
MAKLNIMSLFVATALVATPVAVFAHAKLVSSTPAVNATVAKPAKITLTFNEKLTGPTVKVELFMTGMAKGMSHDGGMDHSKMAGGKMDHGAMADHAPMKIAATSQLGKDGKSVSLMPKRALSAGKYKVDWTAAGADMHKMTGNYSFTVK